MRGIAHELEGNEAVNGRLLARALSAGADAAYNAVPNPVEGTILTVARRAADAACAASTDDMGLIHTLNSAHEAARAAVAETPELLPILKQASVVDAGGEGLRVLLEGILLHFKGESIGSGSVPVGMRVDFSSLHTDGGDFYGYCTEVLFRGEELSVDAIRGRLTALGTCVLAVGDSELMKVHVHTPQPGAVLDMATELGEIVRVKVEEHAGAAAGFRGGARTTAIGTAAAPGYRARHEYRRGRPGNGLSGDLRKLWGDGGACRPHDEPLRSADR